MQRVHRLRNCGLFSLPMFLAVLALSFGLAHAAFINVEEFRKLQQNNEVTKAIAVMKGNSTIMGTIIFTQEQPNMPLTISGNITSLDPFALRGLHVHQWGDSTNGCVSAGLHYNPSNTLHGGPTDPVHHFGDLGNVGTDGNGMAQFVLTSNELSLQGPFSILGRTIVLHAGTDDLGRGTENDSLIVGHSGGRPACGIIGIAPP